MTDFTYRKAIEGLCFLNVPLLDLREISKAAAERGLLFFSMQKLGLWQTLDREELLSPVAFLQPPGVSAGDGLALREGRLELREEHEFRPWNDLGEPRYSVWQLLSLGQLSGLLQIDWALDRLEHGLDEVSKRLSVLAGSIQDKSRFEGHAESWKRNDLLLIRTQHLLLPKVTGHYRSPALVPELGDQDPFEWTREQQQSFNYQQAAEEFSVDADELASLYEGLSEAGQRLDPIAAWFDLADQVKRRERERLTGDALRGYDHYLAARVIRGWHARLDGTEPLPDINERRHGRKETREVQERLYGEADIRSNRAALPGILEHFGLYPWRVQILAEGRSEERMLQAIFEYGYGDRLEVYGIRTVDLKGAGIPKKAEAILSDVRTYANYYFLLLDNEGTAPKFVEELRRRDVIEVDPESRLWEASLEADNFTIDEICSLLERMAREAGVEGLALDRGEVENRYQGGKKGLADVIVRLAEERTFRVSKPDVAEQLGLFALENQELNGERRPILEVAEHLLRLAGADRRLGGRLRKN